MPDKPQTLYLLDSHALLYRAYHAIRPGSMLAADRKTPTNALFGFTNTIRSLRNRFKPDLLAAVFDPHGDVKRTEQYNQFASKLGKAFSGYKTHRDAVPDDLRPQIDIAFELCDAYGIPSFQIEGYEADDVLGTLANAAKNKGLHVVVVSGDKDLLQLVCDEIQCYDPLKDIMYDADTVFATKGVKPTQIVDWLGFRGDAVDNIPGVTGVGDQTATKLLQAHGSLDAVLEHYQKQFAPKAPEILAFVAAHEAESEKEKDARQALKPPKGVKVVDAYIFAQAECALASRELAKLVCDVPFEFDLEKMRDRPPEPARLVPLFKRLDFNTFMRDLDQAQVKVAEAAVAKAKAVEGDLFSTADHSVPTTSTHHLIDDSKSLAAFLKLLKAQKRFAFSTKLTGQNPRQDDLIGISFSWREAEAHYVQLRGSAELSAGDILNSLKPIFEDKNVGKVGQNLKSDIQALRHVGIHLKGLAFDTMLAGWALDPGMEKFDLDELVYHHLLFRRKAPEPPGRRKPVTNELIPDSEVSSSGCSDAECIWQLSEKLAPMLDKAGLTPLMNEIEVPLADVLADMEWTGVRVDSSLLQKMSKKLEHELAAQEADIYQLAGEKFNISSTKQLGAVLFEKLGLSPKGKTATGRDSTSEEVLQVLAKEHELPRRIIEFRGMLKLKNTYLDALPQMISTRTGRIHATFRQTGAETGRLASIDPNLQNIPVRSDLGRQIRGAFIPGFEGWKILAADYSQIELRILAHYSQDDALLRAFEQGIDIHTAVAARLNQIPETQVSRNQRAQAKAVNFGILYGQSAFGLSGVLEISRREAQNIIDAYFSNHPGVRRCIDEIIEKAREQGYITTVMGRRRFIPQLRASDRGAKALGERLAVNTVFQGSAADLIKKAMIDIQHVLRSEGWHANMILQIHDELLFESHPDEVENLAKMVKERMENAIKMSVPLSVDFGIGDSWLSAKN